jgi:hypothetical protein
MNFIKYVFGSKEEDDIINNYKTKKVKNILYINNELKSNYINQIIYILLLHSKLILIDNILEIFHFIRSIFYRSYYDYYNEIDNINYKLLKKLQFEIEGYIKHKDILNKEIINKKYKIFKIIEMKLENKINYTYDDINKLQNNSILFKKYINTFF